MSADHELESTRLDKWLWAARCFKTRSQATAACAAGQVEVNEETAKPARKVAPGDRVVCRTPGGRRVLEVRAIAEKRGPAAEAARLFVDHTPPEPPRGHFTLAGEQRERGAGRPTKRERRQLDRLREG